MASGAGDFFKDVQISIGRATTLSTSYVVGPRNLLRFFLEMKHVVEIGSKAHVGWV